MWTAYTCINAYVSLCGVVVIIIIHNHGWDVDIMLRPINIVSIPQIDAEKESAYVRMCVCVRAPVCISSFVYPIKWGWVCGISFMQIDECVAYRCETNTHKYHFMFSLHLTIKYTNQPKQQPNEPFNKITITAPTINDRMKPIITILNAFSIILFDMGDPCHLYIIHIDNYIHELYSGRLMPRHPMPINECQR